jgi:type II secretory pathway pseudopilin PulG
MESLIVMAILGILVTLAVPLFKSAKLAGAQAQTAGNMRGIGLALQSYIADHNGTLPGPTTVALFNLYLGGIQSPGATPCGLQQYLGPYLDQGGAPWQPATSDYVHVPMMDFPALSSRARASDGVAQYVNGSGRFSKGPSKFSYSPVFGPERIVGESNLLNNKIIALAFELRVWMLLSSAA